MFYVDLLIIHRINIRSYIKRSPEHPRFLYGIFLHMVRKFFSSSIILTVGSTYVHIGVFSAWTRPRNCVTFRSGSLRYRIMRQIVRYLENGMGGVTADKWTYLRYEWIFRCLSIVRNLFNSIKTCSQVNPLLLIGFFLCSQSVCNSHVIVQMFISMAV